MNRRMRPRARTVLRLCLFTVHGASHLVPSSDREDWRGMWDAELWHRVLQLDRHGRLTLRAGAALFHRCLGAYWHAAWVFGRSLAPRALLAGTVLELLVSGPAHVWAVRRQSAGLFDHDCYCARGSYTGLVFGCTALVWLFGPGVFLLVLRERKRREELDINR